jgi:bifunctional UDP-N-acetylglucosamine pyrophosphorylase/glucosamine-1-phosphate N-acetyltransferase
MKKTSVLLAAGRGTRMRSQLTKVLHHVAGQPMIWHALQVAKSVTDEPPVVIIGHGADEVRQELCPVLRDEERDVKRDEVRDVIGKTARFVIQEEQLGTGHAVQQAQKLLQGKTDLVLVTSADMPLLTSNTLRRLVEEQASNTGPISMLTVISDLSRGFGRVVRNISGEVVAIVEEAHATEEQLKIRELNVGAYCYNASWLWDALTRIPLSPKGEYYLTDLIGIAIDEGLPVKTLTLDDPLESIGINTRIHLAEAETAMRQRINQQWMLAGVTIIDPKTTYIDARVTIGSDTTIWPNTSLQGDTVIGQACSIGPNTVIRHSRLGSHCQVSNSVLEHAVVEDQVDIGPFGHLRKGAHLARGVHMGNFGEVKDAYLGPGAKIGHFSYVGDATVGPGVNIGAGTITCNYDGKQKHHTEIGENAFIGSDTMLVAPIKIGEGARTGAGAVVTKDVPPKGVAVGIPARTIRKLDESE